MKKSYVKNRAAEPSTWGGIAALASIALQFVPPQYHPLAGAVATVVGSLAGAVAVFKKSASSPDHPDNTFTQQ